MLREEGIELLHRLGDVLLDVIQVHMGSAVDLEQLGGFPRSGDRTVTEAFVSASVPATISSGRGAIFPTPAYASN
ncbi:hypothetical protein [Hoyosella subflava]|uniref:Uncharacterized protein n=1 Tax=Hoyosella subflava (strain DSM 45089 / JCM 17490 / NBRC 109087 / DQS3-9A1) TaxID=443218 RepID=F6EMZ3_HOYSD|nr:hypothetical protein [Hoyosella subflava]AEF42885.1 hypothetical protein AS9A_4452 [Hoyosella subflava DQS3-9A1]